MNTQITMFNATPWPRVRWTAAAGVLLAGVFQAFAQRANVPGAAGEPYPSMPRIAPIGARIAKIQGVPESVKGPAIDPAKGYRLQMLGEDLY